MQDHYKVFYIYQEKLHFSVKLGRCMQDSVQDLASLARKILARLAYFLQDGFYWVILHGHKEILKIMDTHNLFCKLS